MRVAIPNQSSVLLPRVTEEVSQNNVGLAFLIDSYAPYGDIILFLKSLGINCRSFTDSMRQITYDKRFMFLIVEIHVGINRKVLDGMGNFPS